MKKIILGCVLAMSAVFPALAQNAASQQVAGEAVVVIGRAFAADVAGQQRVLRRGDTLFAGETISTSRHSYVNVVYTDKGRTLVGPDSSLQILEYSYTPPSGGPRDKANAASSAGGRTVFSLLKGGFRAVTGLIGKSRRADYSIRTSVATIGIRGTDAVYVDCRDGRCGDMGPGSEDENNSVVIGVYEGGVTATNAAGETADVDPGQFLQATRDSFARLAGMPSVLLTMPLADPKTCE